MHIITCVDDNGGTFFNNRRQSQDRLLREHILTRCAGKKLWMNAYSARQFASCENADITVDEDFLAKAQPGDYCFAEGLSLAPCESRIERLILIKWNRDYPFDRKLDIDLSSWNCISTDEFTGYSHEKITVEVYTK